MERLKDLMLIDYAGRIIVAIITAIFLICYYQYPKIKRLITKRKISNTAFQSVKKGKTTFCELATSFKEANKEKKRQKEVLKDAGRYDNKFITKEEMVFPEPIGKVSIGAKGSHYFSDITNVYEIDLQYNGYSVFAQLPKENFEKHCEVINE